MVTRLPATLLVAEVVVERVVGRGHARPVGVAFGAVEDHDLWLVLECVVRGVCSVPKFSLQRTPRLTSRNTSGVFGRVPAQDLVEVFGDRVVGRVVGGR